MQVYNVIAPTAQPIPVIISVPHCGTVVPEEIRRELKPELLSFIDDTDWFVDRLYDFCPGLGIAMITANISRWAIDLNRDPSNKPLYNDGRVITGLCTTTDFLGNKIYEDGRDEVSTEDVAERLAKYYLPYHNKLIELLEERHSQFGRVLLWDCHSIKQWVPSIRKEKFPDLILGSDDGRSAAPDLISVAVDTLKNDQYGFSHNHPFKGGYITRKYGQPAKNFHALQLEMSKVNYMDDEERRYDERRGEIMRSLLSRTLLSLSNLLLKQR